MRPIAPFFVEHAGRMYEVMEMDGPPRDGNGRTKRCVMNIPQQRFEFAPGVADDERQPLICRVLSVATGGDYRQLVPFVGSICANEREG